MLSMRTPAAARRGQTRGGAAPKQLRVHDVGARQVHDPALRRHAAGLGRGRDPDAHGATLASPRLPIRPQCLS